MIGQAEIHNGLYHLHTKKGDRLICSMYSNNVFKSNNKLDIWHCRMGHPSNRVLEKLAKKYSDVHFDNMNVCTPCHLAKQLKLPFPLSKTFSKHVFDLVHMDI